MSGLDGVQSNYLTNAEFNKLSKAERKRYSSASDNERVQITAEFRRAQKTETEEEAPGTVVQESNDKPLTEEQQTAKAEAKSKKQKEIDEMKKYAEEHKSEAEGVGKNLTLTAGGDLKSSKNEQKLKDELLKLYMENDELPTLEGLMKEPYNLSEKQAKKALKLFEDLGYKKTHFAAHDAYVDRKDYREAKKAELEAGVKRSDFKENNTLIKNKKVREYVQENFTTDDNLNMQAYKDHVDDYTGTDFTVNYGVHRKHNGGTGQDEYREIKADTDLTKNRQVRKYVEGAGGFAERSDKAGKVLEGGAIGAGIGSLLGSAISGLAGDLHLTAEAEAEVANSITGDILAYDYAEAAETVARIGLGTAAGTGAIIGAVVGMGATAIAYNYDGQRDIMNGYEIADVVDDPALMLKGIKNPNDVEQLPVVMLGMLKTAGVPDNEIVAAIQEAKGNATGSNVNIEEFISAVKMLKYKNKTDETSQAEEPDEVPPEKPEFKTDVIPGEEHGHYEHTQTGLKHKSGLFADTIVREGYTRADDQPLTEKQIKEIRDKIQYDNNVNKLQKVPETWILDNEITLSDGTKVKLKSQEELDKIQPRLTEENNRFGINKTPQELKTQYVYEYTEHGYTVSKKEPGETEFKVVANGNGFQSAQEAQKAADAKKAELEAAENE